MAFLGVFAPLRETDLNQQKVSAKAQRRKDDQDRLSILATS
jgi:hypothetical protein